MINTAMVGFGLSAQTFHLPFIHSNPQFALKAIVSSKPAQVASLPGNIKCYATIDELLHNVDIELVVVTSPNHTHYEYGEKILRAGHHLVMEKPLAVSLKETQALTLLAEQQQRLLFPFHNRRFDGDFLTLKNLISTGAVGDIKCVESRMDRFRPTISEKWKEQTGVGTGLWFDLGPHLLDQTLHLFGEPDALTANIVAQRSNCEVPDYFDVTLHFPDKLVKLGGSNLHAAPQRRFLLQGTTATYEKYGHDPQEQQLIAGMDPHHEDYGVSLAQQQGKLYDKSSQAIITTKPGHYGNFYRGVANTLNNNVTPEITTADALLVAKYIDMAIKSQEMGKTIMVRQYRD